MADENADDRQRQAEESFAMALGFLNWSWNSLHEELGHLFSAIIADGALSDSALAAWHSHNSDRGQRDMLKATAKHALATRPKLNEEIDWLVGQLNALSDNRNNAIHASYATLSSGGSYSVIANSYYGNRRSQRLEGKGDLALEFNLYRATTDEFINYATNLFQCVIDEARPLPTRPRR